MSDEEKEIFERSVKPHMGIIARIKLKLQPKKVIKTIKDVEFLDYDMLIKLLCIMMIYAILRAIGVSIFNLWQWLFPRAQSPEQKYRYFIPLVRGLVDL